jgi:hypothetical protein
MRIKIYGGTPQHSGPSLCTSCTFSLITRGQTPAETLVECRVSMMDARFIPFKVTSCTGYHDATLPSYAEMVRIAWILNPNGKKRRAAGFVRGKDLTDSEFRQVMTDGPRGPY